jgi:hypothetical protein
MKQAAKTSITRFKKKKQRKTGGGPGPSEGDTPSDMDWAIHNVLTILELVFFFFNFNRYP